MKDVMIATGNSNKVKEYREILEPLGYIVHDLKEIEHLEVEETGSTFAENALIKAENIKDIYGMIVIADDSGLEIEALDNQPGIHSARFLAGYDYDYKNKKILEMMKDETNRKARFVCAIALIDDKKHVFEGVMEGSIAYEMKGNNGFGYDPIFMTEEYGLTSAQLTSEQKNEISHRGKATRLLLEYLRRKK
ncbi:MAG: RdgB/HAM1 family non-canonical purine NTP pyrophosphatase [Bacillota bacterium]|jgi:XTP/dITP diphosphohydrolase|nr:RdgB/HAM1 family non-canonical purine NTP pyrophosphatase [Bacillota bacterium]NLL26928.1 RdgB/HAM1 family non-canonical purine NTP pyrophosphatase [Erysipelotrichia bacterium]